MRGFHPKGSVDEYDGHDEGPHLDPIRAIHAQSTEAGSLRVFCDLFSVRNNLRRSPNDHQESVEEIVQSSDLLRCGVAPEGEDLPTAATSGTNKAQGQRLSNRAATQRAQAGGSLSETASTTMKRLLGETSTISQTETDTTAARNCTGATENDSGEIRGEASEETQRNQPEERFEPGIYLPENQREDVGCVSKRHLIRRASPAADKSSRGTSRVHVEALPTDQIKKTSLKSLEFPSGALVNADVPLQKDEADVRTPLARKIPGEDVTDGKLGNGTYSLSDVRHPSMFISPGGHCSEPHERLGPHCAPRAVQFAEITNAC